MGELLFKNGADMGASDNDEDTALHWCAMFGYVKFADMLLQSHNHPSGADEPPAPSAPGMGSAETKPKLPLSVFQTRHDFEARNKKGKTLLHLASRNLASRNGHIDFLNWLMDSDRVNLTAADNDGLTALHHGV